MYDNAKAEPGAIRATSEIESRMRSLADTVERVDNIAHQLRSRIGSVLSPEYPDPPSAIDRSIPKAVDNPRSDLSVQLEALTARLDGVVSLLSRTVDRVEL